MEVILKEDVEKLGHRGDVVKVAEGYGRNFLLPRKLAIEATKGNRTVIEEMKAAAQRRAVRDRADAEGLAKLRLFDARSARDLLQNAVTIEPWIGPSSQ